MQSKIARWGRICDLVGWLSCGLLGVMVLAVLCPMSAGLASAADETLETIYSQSSISLAVDAELALEVSPTLAGSFVETGAELTVGTSNAAGYSLYLATLTGRSTLDSVLNDEKIESISGNNMTQAEFTAGTWGYSLGKTGVQTNTYSAVPGLTSKVLEEKTDGLTEETGSYELKIAALIDTATTAGKYQNGLVLSAIANPKEMRTLNDAVYMQDFDGTSSKGSKICAQSAVGDSKRLIDVRDGKKYWVAKLADGNCWMTQNLALDLDTNKTLTPADTDVTANWKPAYSTFRTTNFNVTNANGLAGYSWNLGDYVLATPQRSARCTNGSGDGVNSVSVGQTLARCTDFQLVDDTWADAPSRENATWNGYTGIIAADSENKTYDAHYLIGNYYQWNAAAAGSTTGTTKSICPKGWMIPDDVTTAGAKSYQLLLKVYGYPLMAINTPTPLDQDGATRPDYEPIYMVRSGVIDLASDRRSLRGAGGTGFLWASVSGDVGQVYLDVKDVYPTFRYGDRVFPVRCVAR